jgi:class 3 adenylate cyclase
MPVPEAAGERRHVTVMFCDLVDSTGIAARLDAEEWRDLVGAYLDAASAAVTEMGGKVAKKLGDGLMALFGYPVAQENDAERAVRAGLSIQRALAELNRKNAGSGKPALAARIAVESGPVVVDAAGEIFGDVPNIAARAQALAEPAVVVTGRGSLIVVLDRAQGGRSRPLRWWRTLTPQSLRPVLLAARRVTYRINAKFGFSALRCYFANPLPKLG